MSDLKMPDLNRVIIAGRLANDPEVRHIPSGTAVCKMRLASSSFYKSNDGERKEDTTFVNVEVWDRLAEFCGDTLKKGRPVLVEGSLKSDEWEDKSTGQKRTAIKIRAQRVHQLDWDDRGGGPSRSSSREEEPAAEDDIPF